MPGPARDGCDSDVAIIRPGTSLYTDPAMGVGLQTLRFAQVFSLLVPEAFGLYKITITAVEPNKTGPGQRLFRIVANNAATPLIDLWATSGPFEKHTVSMFALSNGILQLDFSATIGNAVYNRIDVQWAILWVDPPPRPAVIQ